MEFTAGSRNASLAPSWLSWARSAGAAIARNPIQLRDKPSGKLEARQVDEIWMTPMAK